MRQGGTEEGWRPAPVPTPTKTRELMLAKLAVYFEDIWAGVKRRRSALAWILDDGDPGDLFSFPAVCDELDIGVGFGRRRALREAIAAELEHRQALLVRRGRITLSLDPAGIEADLIRAARRHYADTAAAPQRGVGSAVETRLEPRDEGEKEAA